VSWAQLLVRRLSVDLKRKKERKKERKSKEKVSSSRIILLRRRQCKAVDIVATWNLQFSVCLTFA
jgi:hypothetical protein